MGDSVFLVNGRNRQAREFLTDVLHSLGLKILHWKDAGALTGQTAPHARDVLMSAMAAVDAVVVLMSDDEEARLRPELCEDEVERHIESILQPQPRPNSPCLKSKNM
jgi:hypothetical protein